MTAQVTRDLPTNPEAETGLLGCALIDGPNIVPDAIKAGITPKSFRDIRHEIVFKGILALFSAGTPVEDSYLATHLTSTGELERIGGHGFITQLTANVPTTIHVRKFIEAVLDTHHRRELLGKIERASLELREPSGRSFQEIASEFEMASCSTNSTRQIRALTVWSTTDFEAYQPPADNAIMGDESGRIYWRDGQLALLIGPGGVGKSRFSLSVAVSQLLQRNSCGFTFLGPPRRWLFLGSENSAQRFKSEFAKLCRDLTAEQKTLIASHLLIQGPDPEGDDDLCLDDPRNIARLKATAEAFRPDVVVLDPWEGVIEGGDCNDATATRSSVRLIRGLFGPHSARSTILVIHHAKEGAEAARKAEGFDASGYVKGSKTLRSMARFAINVAPQDPEDGGRIVLACGKCNDERPFTTRGAVLDEQTAIYHLDRNFDLEEWRADVEGKRGGKSCAIRDVVEAVREGKHKTGDIVELVKDTTGACQRTIKARIADAVGGGYLQSCPPRGNYTLGIKQL